MRPERQGTCAAFRRKTDAISGQDCRSFQNNAQARERHGQAVENAILAKHPNVT